MSVCCLLKLLLILAGVMFPLVVQAAPQVCVVLSATSESYRQVGGSLVNALQEDGGGIEVLVSNANELSKDPVAGQCGSALIVAVGGGATGYSLKSFPASKVISTFVAQNTLENLLENTGSSADKDLVGAVYLDQPAARLLQLIKLINPMAKTVASLTGPRSSARVPSLQSAADSLGLSLRSRQIDVEGNPVQQLEKVMAESDAYLVLPDNARINRNTARWIIYLSYKYYLPVIAYSRKYVDAGALVSLFTTPEQIGRQTAAMVKSTLQADNQVSGQFQYPLDFDVAINEKVRRALNLTRFDTAELKSALQAAETLESQLSGPDYKH